MAISASRAPVPMVVDEGLFGLLRRHGLCSCDRPVARARYDWRHRWQIEPLLSIFAGPGIVAAARQVAEQVRRGTRTSEDPINRVA